MALLVPVLLKFYSEAFNISESTALDKKRRPLNENNEPAITCVGLSALHTSTTGIAGYCSIYDDV